MVVIEFDADEEAVTSHAGYGGCAAAQERVEDAITNISGGVYAAFDEGDWFLSGVFPVNLLGLTGRWHFPHCFHLLTSDTLHRLVIEEVFALFGFGGPEDGFGGVGEVTAAQVGRWIGFFPGDVVEDFEAELLHGVADAEDDVVRARDPDGAVGFQDALAAFEPFGVEFVVEFGAARLVPVAFVDFDHFAGVTGDAAVGEEVGRVGEDHVETAVGVLGGDGVHNLEAVALVEEDAVGVVAVNAIERGEGAGFHDDAVQRTRRAGIDKAFGRGGIMDRMDRVGGMDRGAGTTCFFYFFHW